MSKTSPIVGARQQSKLLPRAALVSGGPAHRTAQVASQPAVDPSKLPCEALAQSFQEHFPDALTKSSADTVRACRRTWPAYAGLTANFQLSREYVAPSLALDIIEPWGEHPAAAALRAEALFQLHRELIARPSTIDDATVARAKKIGGPLWELLESTLPLLRSALATGRLPPDAKEVAGGFVGALSGAQLGKVLRAVALHPEDAQMIVRIYAGVP
ncbi:MAG: hypothetical protein JNK04_05115 [Myxococcales bacterium]|nr:hypothetical protein [Myxococcales bacterium]